MSDPNLPSFLDVETIGTTYGVSDDTVTRWIKDGELIAFKLSKRWLIHPDDWRAFIDRRRDAAAAQPPTKSTKPAVPVGLRASTKRAS